MENERVELDELKSKILSKRDFFNLFKFNSGYGFSSVFLFFDVHLKLWLTYF